MGHARVDDVVHDRDPYYPSHEPTIVYGAHEGAIIRAHPVSKRPMDIELDYYQHPDKRFNRTIRYSRSHDIYSLGVVLLEIGLWRPVREVVDVEDEDFERVKRGFQALTMKLDG